MKKNKVWMDPGTNDWIDRHPYLYALLLISWVILIIVTLMI